MEMKKVMVDVKVGIGIVTYNYNDVTNYTWGSNIVTFNYMGNYTKTKNYITFNKENVIQITVIDAK